MLRRLGDRVVLTSDVGDWLVAREDLWDGLVDDDYRTLPLGDRRLDPYDTVAVNGVLEHYGLVYSAGLENCAKPHFYLAELEREEEPVDGFSMRISGRELARGLNSPPAMLREETI